MPNYLYPGVYVEEVSSGTRPIQAVGTSTAAFIGVAPSNHAPVNELVWIKNWSEFVKVFVDSKSDETQTRPAKKEKPAAGPKDKKSPELTAAPVPEPETEQASTDLLHAVYGYFLNGGGRCCVINIGRDGSLTGGRTRQGLDLLEETDEVSIVAAPGMSDAQSWGAILSHCEKMKNRIAILDAPADVKSIDNLTNKLKPRQSAAGMGAYYFPHIKVADPLDSKRQCVVPPSGHIAGIYARTDGLRGVHKAPANEIIRGALDVDYRLTPDEQGVLNPVGVNCIRYFAGEGIKVYGARTVADPSSDWRYVNVRRLLIMIEESIARSTRWAVFEPNDQTLWMSLKRDATAFLTSVWRQGGLMGNSPEEAFFVKCDDETNPQEEIDQGRVIILIGVAPVKPAEFVIFRIGQSAAGAE